jgi:penicillin amidase
VKLIRFITLIFAIILTLFWGSGFVLKKIWSKDKDTIEVVNQSRQFSAKRNEIGVWKVEVNDEESLWFAMGFLQAHDREFQTELYRHFAMGWLSQLFGENLLTKDRLMRAWARVSREEWYALPEQSLTKRASIAYVEGRNYWLQQNKQSSPVEYKLFRINREELPPWEAWQVLALSRAHAWEHSFDLNLEMEEISMKNILGIDLAQLLLSPFEDPQSILYTQESVKNKIKVAHNYNAVNALAYSFNSDNQDHRQSSKTNFNNSPDFSPFSIQGPAFLAASNAWIVADDRRPLSPTFCNDTHLRFSWPAPFYPISYEIKNQVNSKGYSLPGSPIIVIGEVATAHRESTLNWGITLGAFANSQDLVELSESSAVKSEKYEEKYVISDPLSGEKSEKKLIEEWTSYGPRVDSYLNLSQSPNSNRAVALDWIGARYKRTPMEFFLKRNLFVNKNLIEDLKNDWVFPTVNFSWIATENKKTFFGHMLTGNLFLQERQSFDSPLLEKTASLRKISQAKDRPYLNTPYDSGSFLMSMANQAVYSSQQLNKSLAKKWVPPFRASQILNQKDQLIFNPSFSQSDYKSQTLKTWLVQMKNIQAAEFCKKFPNNEKKCLTVLQDLSSWDGITNENTWQTSLASLWFENFKFELWGNNKIHGNKDSMNVFEHWTNGYSIETLVAHNLSSKEWRARFEKVRQKSIQSLLELSLQNSLSRLEENFGWDLEKWQWKYFHTIDWYHPINNLPQPVGKMLLESLLGPPISVSGAWDSPGRYQYHWSPEESLNFPAAHGAVMRFCSTPQENKFDWTLSTGVSGNPFSPWAWTMARDYFLKNKLFRQ